MTAEIRGLPEAKPKSKESFLDVLRLHLDLAARKRMTYLEITYKTEGMAEPNSISISDP